MLAFAVRELHVIAFVIALSPAWSAFGTDPHVAQTQQLRPTDELLEQLVESALAADPVAEAYETVVTVLDGKVTLYGTVDTDRERARAGSVASEVEGVVEVENEITVEHSFVPQDRSDVEISLEISDEIDSHFPDEEINASVQDGLVTLTGAVSSADVRRRTTEIAFHAGALLVKNEIRVEPE